ncbi:26S proteasome regulatory complex, non-ATPase subcomplex, Rpn2/Psmd1 subunit [Wallemia mellicola]|uniref:26S proteasome regulatory subunit RPN2 n=1 Tax=Wallemia mellicola TaxID=1708541 RepID=A0A4T0QRZ8_9BASI|nr:26S proteasome regulatory complex, non-ATPase subcomplex, Rpn2/Psmd1 subunit [Wallemia mellicola]TIB95595.1 26S proteasome regulatory complex, non-ATPase subcomplex, Rpn2/Psmd1 subunit [Wallemia mellicola]TIC01934.1 26S proteasome regulatory complex, non-ATPase subcomplex, Rpn2/Psmd1 subunit [Wallemia mellicola]TIC09020.1 26S proteasome regulatory complex, non-ATPase subcomplex, Rpn2/Psmd1 subunit [Wallemia mellicola]TIC25126.1 26S proteasome regulatory complex, non-ATPase subcomplex, Rpn2/P
MSSLTTAAGILSLLDEDDITIKTHALTSLIGVVDQFWAEISDYVGKIESLSEDEKFSPDSRKLAALIASRVYYHLGAIDDSLSLALGAGSAFDVSQSNEFVETLISKSIDTYVHLRQNNEKVDSRLENIVNRMFDKCISDKEYKQAAGIALDSLRYDIIEKVFNLSKDVNILRYVMEATSDVIVSLEQRQVIFKLLVKLFSSNILSSPDYFSITQCHLLLNDGKLAGELLDNLIKSNKKENTLIAYQIAFDLVDTASQDFLSHVTNVVKEGEGETYDKLKEILSGTLSIRLNLEFLHRNNKADPLVLKNTKESLDGKFSLYHNAVSFANAFMHAGTTNDTWLRDNLEWLGKANNWSKFTATAALGVIHKGNLNQSIQLLEPYLPGATSHASEYSEGGSLYALGLIHANNGGHSLNFLLDHLKRVGATEVVQHGAALGLGIAGIATKNEELYTELRNVLFSDSAIAGEAAGYAMGLIMLGTGNESAYEEMLQYAHETQHEKIIRGLAIGIAFLMYGRESEADKVIENLLNDKDWILRYGGVYTIGLAYAGTGNNKAIQNLLHVAVSDVNDDVRRVAVIALGFILYRNPSQVPRLVQLLSESYNPHVRCGAAMALGIACAGTALDDAIELLEPLSKDPVDFVRQYAYISLALVLIQSNEQNAPKSKSIREHFAKVVSDRHDESMAKFGAAIAQGLIDAGGRNSTISMQSKNGSTNISSLVGMTLFTQFWFWFPLVHCISLSFTPTSLIGLDAELKIPEMEFVSNVKPSQFAYVKALKPPTKETAERVATAVLSTTARAQARHNKAKKEKEEAEGGGDVEMEEKEEKEEITNEEESKKVEVKEPEPEFESKSNLSRVTPNQVPFIVFSSEGRYTPVRSVSQVPATTRVNNGSGSSTPVSINRRTRRPTISSIYSTTPASAGGAGILILNDHKEGEEVKYITLEAGGGQGGVGSTNAATTKDQGGVDDGIEIDNPPEAFEFNFDQSR